MSKCRFVCSFFLIPSSWEESVRDLLHWSGTVRNMATIHSRPYVSAIRSVKVSAWSVQSQCSPCCYSAWSASLRVHKSEKITIGPITSALPLSWRLITCCNNVNELNGWHKQLSFVISKSHVEYRCCAKAFSFPHCPFFRLILLNGRFVCYVKACPVATMAFRPEHRWMRLSH